jgi:hypothetical protein
MKRLLRLTLLIIFLFFSQTSFSQVTFQIAFGGTGYDVSHMMMEVTSNGNYIVTGETYSFGVGSDDIYTALISTTGTVLWSKTYGNSGSERSNCVRQTSDGGYAVCGYMAMPGRSYDACLLKTDASGNIVWVKTYGGTLGEEALSLRQTFDGGYILVGSTSNYTSTVNSEMYVIRTDAFGNEIWSHSYGVNGFLGDYAGDVHQTADSNFVVMGKTSTPGLYDVALLKLNYTNGAVLWSKKYNIYSYDNAETFQVTTDGGFIICGYASTGANEDAFLLKTDASGNVQWTKLYADVYSNRGWGVIQTSDRGYAFTGAWYQGSITGTDMYILKTDDSGNLLWMKTMGSLEDDLGYIIHQTPDGGYAVSGITCCGNVGPGDRDFMLSKTDQDGNILGLCNLLVPTVTVTSPAIAATDIFLNVNTFGNSQVPLTFTTDPNTQNVVVCTMLPLPVQLLSFSAQKEGDKQVVLTWQTASEINNNYFDVERNTNGSAFQKIGTIAGAGNSTALLNYTFNDEYPGPGINYYRLKQVDYDGNYTYSGIKAVRFNQSKEIIIYPAPDGRTVFISADGNYTVKVYNIVGSLLLQEAINHSDKTIDLSSLNTGLYFISCGDKTLKIFTR